jgi:hypothetical protein
MNRWPRTRLGRLGLASWVLFAAFACLPLTSARASFANAEFIITPFGSTPVTLQYSQLEELTSDVPGQAYQVIATPGAAASTVTVDGGYSLNEILTKAGVAPASFSYAEVTFGSAESTLLSAAQATAPLTTADPPVFYENGSTMNFADQSPSEYISGPAQVYVNLYPGPELTVTAAASPRAIKAGQDVELTATVSNPPSGATLKYQWDDGNGDTYGTGSPLRHPFAIPGTYYAYATVVGSDGSVGISAAISFAVGKAPKGPNRTGGGRSKNPKAATSGPGTKGSPSAKGTNAKGNSNAGTTSSSSSATTAPAKTTSTTTVAPARRPPSPRRAPAPVPHRAGPSVSGILLAGVDSASRPPASSAARAGALHPARTGHVVARRGRGLAEGFWLALGVCGAVLGGALLEWRGPSRLSSLMTLAHARLR